MGLRVSIYRSDYRGGLCLFGHVNELTLVNVDGHAEPTPDAPAAWLDADRLVYQRPAPRIVPIVDGKPMDYVAMGGSYAATSGSPWSDAVPFYGAVAIHDWDLSRDTQTGD